MLTIYLTLRFLAWLTAAMLLLMWGALLMVVYSIVFTLQAITWLIGTYAAYRQDRQT